MVQFVYPQNQNKISRYNEDNPIRIHSDPAGPVAGFD